MVLKENVRSLLRIPFLNKHAIRRLNVLRDTPLGPLLSRLPIIGVIDVPIKGYGSLQIISDGLDSTATLLFWKGLRGYEPEVTRLFRELSKASQTIIDIGADTSFLTLLFSILAPKATILAFEPAPDIFHRLEKNIEFNQCKNCTPFQIAIGNRTEKVELFIPRVKSVPMAASLNKAFSGTVKRFKSPQ